MKNADLNERRLDAFAAMLEPMAEIIAAKDVMVEAKSGNLLRAAQAAIGGHKKAVIGLLAAIDETPVEEYTVPEPVALLLKMVNFFSSPVMTDLFSSQAQNVTGAASGSATANTEGGAN